MSVMRVSVRALAALLLVSVAVVLAGCGSGIKDDPVLRLSASEALEQGRALLDAKKYRQAGKYLIHAFQVEPNSVSGRDGLLLAAEALFLQDRFDAYVEAESRYRDFINRFPTSARADYAQFQLARSLAARMEKPNRDQETTRKALAAFEELVRVYPTSEYAEQARAEQQHVRDQLARHEFIVGYFYFRTSGARRARPLAMAAVSRFETVIDKYPGYEDREHVLFYLCRAHHRLEQPEKAAEVCGRLRTEFPESKLLAKIPAGKEAAETVAAPGAVESEGGEPLADSRNLP